MWYDLPLMIALSVPAIVDDTGNTVSKVTRKINWMFDFFIRKTNAKVVPDSQTQRMLQTTVEPVQKCKEARHTSDTNCGLHHSSIFVAAALNENHCDRR